MSEAATAAPEGLPISTVLGDTIRAITRNLGLYAALGALLAGIPSAVGAFLVSASGPFAGQDVFMAAGVQILISLVPYFVLIGAVTVTTVDIKAGRHPSFESALRIGLVRLPGVLALSVPFFLGLLAGYLMLIIPGLVLLVVWVVAFPAYVIEKPPVLRALSRSVELTRGSRWRVAGALLLFVVVAILCAVVIGVVTTVLAILALPDTPGAGDVVMALISGLQSTVSGVLGATFYAMLYAHLWGLRHGRETSAAAEVFA